MLPRKKRFQAHPPSPPIIHRKSWVDKFSEIICKEKFNLNKEISKKSKGMLRAPELTMRDTLDLLAVFGNELDNKEDTAI